MYSTMVHLFDAGSSMRPFGRRALRRLGRLVPPALRRPLARFLRDRAPDPSVPLRAAVAARLVEADRRQTEVWEAVATLDDWNDFVRPRLAALRASLGVDPGGTSPVDVHRTRTRRDDGHAVDHLVFASAPGVWVPAHLYRPLETAEPAPAIVVCHSHHGAKDQAELRDLGVGWARAGCVVLIPDLVGHGERRDHPFSSSLADRQDYRFRHVLGMQLDLVGESLAGWMVRDVVRAVDVLHSVEGVDPARIVLLGAVAGGGDVAAPAAALDPRVACAVPFNYGRPRPVDAVATCFSGAGSWESTRNLRGSARDGFAPWVVLAAVAPRRLVYAHEFGWSPGDDPAWDRLRHVYELHGVPDRLAVVHGRGSAAGRPPENTHCVNVGPVHRALVAPILRDWLGIPEPREEGGVPRSDAEPRSWTPELEARLEPAKVHAIARRRVEARQRRGGAGELRERLSAILGDVEPSPRPIARWRGARRESAGFEVEPGVRVGIRVRLPAASGARVPVVLAVAQDGADALLRARRASVRDLLCAGLAVCAVDVRGAGPSRHDDETRGRRSLATEVASSEAMLGGSLLGARLCDARAALAALRDHPALDTTRVAAWGDSTAPPNRAAGEVVVPFDAEPAPGLGEPLGAVLALLLALYEEDVRAVWARGGLGSFASLLDAPCCHVPRDVVVPGFLAVADVPDLVAALAPRPVRLEATIDGRNLPVDEPARAPLGAAAWIAEALRATRGPGRVGGEPEDTNAPRR